MTTTSTPETDVNNDNNQLLLPIITSCFPNTKSFQILSTVVQSNAKGFLVRTDTGHNLFVKTVNASTYALKKTWPDLRRTLLYARTEARFYNETVPKMEAKGLVGVAPRCYRATYDLEGLIAENDRATDVSNDAPKSENYEGKGGVLVLDAVPSASYFQDSPLAPPDAVRCLKALAKVHAAAWEDRDLLESAEERLSRGSYHLAMRAPKELAGMEEAWDNFVKGFEGYAPELFGRESVRRLGERIVEVAGEISEELSPGAGDRYATLVHGDYKAMNVFLPKGEDGDGSSNAVMIDFASTGVGIGMSDVAMHVFHALSPEDIDEDVLLDAYLTTLGEDRMQYNKEGGYEEYPRDVATRHFRLAVIDYFRFFLGRFWKSATLESMEKKKDSTNINLINRSPEAAMAFVAKVDQFLTEYESEKVPKT